MLPADIESLQLGRMRYSLLLNDQNSILDDLMLSRWRQGVYVVVMYLTETNIQKGPIGSDMPPNDLELF